MFTLLTSSSSFFFFNDTATTEIYTLSLHDALPISSDWARGSKSSATCPTPIPTSFSRRSARSGASSACSHSSCCSRSEEHTSELQSPCNLVCRLLLEKKKKKDK